MALWNEAQIELPKGDYDCYGWGTQIVVLNRRIKVRIEENLKEVRE